MTHEADHEALLRALLDPEHDLDSIAQATGLSYGALGARIADGPVQRSLAGLIELHDARARVLLSQLRMNAIIGLARLAASADSTEPVRKACVDLLTTALPGAGEAVASSSEVDADSIASLHELLEAIGVAAA